MTYIVEALDPDRHDREGFGCGIGGIDNYFKRTANKLARGDNVRVFVMVESRPSGVETPSRVIGFYAVNAHAVSYRELPRRYARTRPSHGNIPAAFIAMMACDREFQGRRFGGVLLANALARIVRAGDEIGISVAMLDVYDGTPEMVARRKGFYKRFGFEELSVAGGLRTFLPIQHVRTHLRHGAHPGAPSGAGTA